MPYPMDVPTKQREQRMRLSNLTALALTVVLTACTARPVYVTNDHYPPLTSDDVIEMTLAPDQPAPDAKRFALTIKQIGVGSQSDLRTAISDGFSNARSIGANHFHVTISEPEARRQKVEISFYRLDKPIGGARREVTAPAPVRK